MYVMIDLAPVSESLELKAWQWDPDPDKRTEIRLILDVDATGQLVGFELVTVQEVHLEPSD